MPPEEAKEENPFPHNWTFIQTPTGIVVLSITMPQGLVPFLKFMTPDRLLAFEDDVHKAVKKFIPVGLRQAIDVVEKGWVDMPEPDEEPPNIGVLA